MWRRMNNSVLFTNCPWQLTLDAYLGYLPLLCYKKPSPTTDDGSSYVRVISSAMTMADVEKRYIFQNDLARQYTSIRITASVSPDCVSGDVWLHFFLDTEIKSVCRCTSYTKFTVESAHHYYTAVVRRSGTWFPVLHGGCITVARDIFVSVFGNSSHTLFVGATTSRGHIAVCMPFSKVSTSWLKW